MAKFGIPVGLDLSPQVAKSGKVIKAQTPAPDIQSWVQEIKEELEKSLDIQKKIREGEFSYDIFVAIKKQLKAHGPGRTLSLGDTIERICMMARYPFTIEPGDWLITRPRSLNEKRPPPLCRETLWGSSRTANPPINGKKSRTYGEGK